jgi:hypothetical protein
MSYWTDDDAWISFIMIQSGQTWINRIRPNIGRLNQCSTFGLFQETLVKPSSIV